MYGVGVKRTRTRHRWYLGVAAVALLAGGQAQNPFQGFPPEAPDPPTSPPPPRQNGATPDLPAPTTPSLDLPPARTIVTAPTPALVEVDFGVFATPLPIATSAEPSVLAWAASRAYAQPLPDYVPPPETGLRLVAVSYGTSPQAVVANEARTFVVRAGDSLPGGVIVARIEPRSVTLQRDGAGEGVLRLAEKPDRDGS